MKTCPICSNDFEDTLGSCPRHEPDAGQISGEPDPLIGAVLRDRYQLTEVIGRGAMGVVYRAKNVNDGKEVAIKVLHTHLASNQESLKRFEHEAKAASSLMHPHIVRLHEIGMGPSGQPYIAMEYLSGITLSDFMRERRHLDTDEALPIIRQVCEALAEAHSHGVLHRDIKPANIMLLNRFGQENFVVVLDFSISKVIQRVSDVDSTTPGLIFGSPAYMSPERFMGRGGDFRSDIYAMGIIMFQMLAGRAPFKSSDLYTLMNEHVGTTPPRVKDIRPDANVPEELEQMIATALAKKPEDRQQNMKQVLSELDIVYRATIAARAEKAGDLAASLEGNGDYSVATLSKATPEQTFGALSSFSKAVDNASVFEIDPGVTPQFSIPAYRMALEESALSTNQQQKLPPELLASGSYNKSLILRAQGAQPGESRQRPNIRPSEAENRFPAELMALASVVIIGLAVIAWTQMPALDPNSLAVQKRLQAQDLNGARDLLTTWHLTLKPADEEKFGEMALQLGKAFAERKQFGEAESCFAAVPERTKYSAEAKRQLSRINKVVPGLR